MRLTEELADRVSKLEREHDHNAINAEIAELARQSRDSENKAIYLEGQVRELLAWKEAETMRQKREAIEAQRARILRALPEGDAA